ncbi:hypothetical protein Csa_018431, partial [Cucumis sativus]
VTVEKDAGYFWTRSTGKFDATTELRYCRALSLMGKLHALAQGFRLACSCAPLIAGWRFAWLPPAAAYFTAVVVAGGENAGRAGVFGG